MCALRLKKRIDRIESILAVSKVYLDQHNDQLPVGLLVRLVEHFTGIAEIMGSNPVRALIIFF